MLISKSFLVIGSTVHKDGKAQKDICGKVDECLNKFFAENPGKLIDLDSNVQINPGVGQDFAFLTITVDADEKVEEVEEAVEAGEVKRRGRPPKDK